MAEVIECEWCKKEIKVGEAYRKFPYTEVFYQGHKYIFHDDCWTAWEMLKKLEG